MSAPDTNIERQREKHKPSLLGIKGAMVVAAIGVLIYVFFFALNGETPTASTVTVDPVATGTNESN